MSLPMGRSGSWLSWALVAWLAGCAGFPGQEPPAPALAKPALQETIVRAQASPEFTAGDWPPTDWWAVFGDRQLGALIETALQGNPGLKIVQARVREAREQVQLAASRLSPRLNADVSLTRERLSENGLFPPPLGGSTFNLADASLGIGYEIDWWDKNQAAFRAALGESKAVEAEAAAVRLILSTAIAESYFSLQEASARLALAEERVASRRQALALVQLRLNHGLVSDLVYRQSLAQLKADEATAEGLRQQVQVDRYQLAALAGHGADWASRIVVPHAAFKGPFPLPARLPLDWIARRPDIAAQRSRVEAAAERVTEARARFYPNLDLAATAGLEAMNLGKLLSPGSLLVSFGPALHLPLFDAGALKAQLGARREQYAVAVEQYNQLVIDAAREVGEALSRFRAASRSLALERDALQAAARAEALARERFDRGLSDYSPVLATRVQALMEQERETALEAERLQAAVALIRSLGGGYAPRKTSNEEIHGQRTAGAQARR